MGRKTSAWPFSGCRYELRKMIFAFAGMRAKSNPSPQISTKSACIVERVPSIDPGEQRASAGSIRILVRLNEQIVFDRARPAGARCPASRRSMKRVPSVRLNAASSSLEPQFETKATGYAASAISRCAASMAVDRSTGRPFFIACTARGRSKIRARSRPLLQIHGPLTAGFSSGVTRSMLTFFAWIERVELPLGLAMPDLHRAAARASRADRGRGLQIPDPRLVEERPRQQRADRADIDHIVGIRIGVERVVFRRRGPATHRRAA